MLMPDFISHYFLHTKKTIIKTQIEMKSDIGRHFELSRNKTKNLDINKLDYQRILKWGIAGLMFITSPATN